MGKKVTAKTIGDPVQPVGPGNGKPVPKIATLTSRPPRPGK